ncbi:hypothetical protein V6N13_030165 [Hibiscus sabdariffa]
MSFGISREETQQPAPLSTGQNGNVVAVLPSMATAHRLRLNPNTEHKPESYEGLQLDFSPLLFSSLERYLPPPLLSLPLDFKLHYMRDIIIRYSPDGERTRVQRHREYRQKIISRYQPLHRELYTMHASNFFAPSFLKAINENKEQSFRSIMAEPIPGVENFEKWVYEMKFRIMRPNTMNKFGAVLDDFGLETMLDKLMEDFIRPISKGF